jgi:lipoyl(octanoyl) transferase
MKISTDLLIRPLKQCDYLTAWQAMQEFTDTRTAVTCDEIWLIEHPPVYTLGQNGKREHILNPGNIPVIPVDRGGQVTYHGPGQLMLYALIDIRRRRIGVRDLVSALEQATIAMLTDYGITAYAKPDAPGVYVNNAKICSLGLRIRRGCSYHGLALNVAMDMAPFFGINPCGYANLTMTQISALGGPSDLTEVAATLVRHLAKTLGYTHALEKND